MLKTAIAFASPNPVDRALGWRGCASTVANVVAHYELDGDELEKSFLTADAALSPDLLGALDEKAHADDRAGLRHWWRSVAGPGRRLGRRGDAAGESRAGEMPHRDAERSPAAAD